MSKFGAACDNLLSAELVTVDGRNIRASQNVNAELFWALRGGGGNYGVITALEYQLHPVNEVLAGTLIYPEGRISELLQAFARFVADAPDEMNVVGQVVATGNGARFQMLVCHCGDPQQGNDLLKPLRMFAPLEDNIRVQPYLQANATVNPAAPAAHFQTNLVIPILTDPVIAVIDSAAGHAPPNTRVFMVPLYGAVSRIGPSDTAFPLRQPCCELDVMGRWSNPQDSARAIEWVKGLRDSLQPFAHGVYVNQLGETSDELVQAAYGQNYARLAAIKRKYDPANVLRLNQNIKPA
jgi:Berberine and berberine like